MTSMQHEFKKEFKFLDIFVFLVPVEILAHYPIFDSSHWLWEGVQLSLDKIFR